MQMGALLKLVLLVHVAAAVGGAALLWAVLTDRYPPTPEVPDIPQRWFGKGDRVKEDPAIEPFQIKVDDKVPSGSDYTFFHKDHVGAEVFRKMSSFGSGQGCFKCHEYRRGSGNRADEYPLKKDSLAAK